jgi:hypothetical protein
MEYKLNKWIGIQIYVPLMEYELNMLFDVKWNTIETFYGLWQSNILG